MMPQLTSPPTRSLPDAIPPTIADAVTDPGMAPVDDDAGGPTADRDDQPVQEGGGEPDEGEVAAQLGDFA